MVTKQILLALIYDVGKGAFTGFRKRRGHENAVSEDASTVAATTDGISKEDLLDIFTAELDNDVLKSTDADEVMSDLAHSLKIRANTVESVDYETVLRQFLDRVERNLIAQGRPEEGIQVLYEYARETNTLTADLRQEIQQLHDQYYDDLTVLSNRSERMAPKADKYRLPGIDKHIDFSVTSDVHSSLDAGENVLLTGPAGVGKSGVLAECYHTWDDERTVYFFDAREFGQLDSLSDIESELGLQNSLRDVFKRIGEQDDTCTVIVDQLDNVRTENIATGFEHLLLDLAELETVSVVCACRRWDLEQDEYQRLRESDQFTQLEVESLNEDNVRGNLSELGIDESVQTATLVELCGSLLNLSLLADVLAQDVDVDVSSITREIALWDEYRESLDEEGSGPQGKIPREWDESPVDRAVGHARTSFQRSTTTFRIDERNPGDQRLQSRETIERDWRRQYPFRHDQLQSYFYAWDAITRDFTIHDVLEDDIDERIAADAFEWMLRFYLDDPSRRTSFVRDTLGSDSDLGFYARAMIGNTANGLGPETLQRDAAIAVIESLQADQQLAREFYRDLESPDWARFLIEEGLLSESGKFAAMYVARLAETYPQVVVDGMRCYDSVEKIQARPYLSVVEALDFDTVESAARVVVEWIHDLEREDVSLMQRDLNQLVGQLLECGHRDATVALVSVLDEPVDLQTETREIGDYTSTDVEFQCPLAPRGVHRLFENHSEQLAEVCGEAVLDALEDHFRTCLTRMSEAYEDEVSPEGTLQRRTALMSVNIQPLEELLLLGIKDVLTHLLLTRPDVGVPRLRAYLDEGGIFKQTAIALLAKHPEQASDLVAGLLTNPQNYEDGQITTEFISLLGSGFELLSEPQRRTVLERIDKGPNKKRLREYVESRSEVKSESEIERVVTERVKVWKLKRLYHIRESVTGDRREFIQKLIEKHGEIEYSPGSGYHLPFSSKQDENETSESFEDLDADEFFAACREYSVPYRDETEDDEYQIEPRSLLSHELRDRILTAPETYLPHLPDIVAMRDVELVESGFSAVEFLITGVDHQDTTIDNWDAVLEAGARFCEPDPFEERWSNDCRRSFAQMMQMAIGHVRSTLAVPDHEERLSEILSVLLGDPDPTPSDQSAVNPASSQRPIRARGVRAMGVVATVQFLRIREGTSPGAVDNYPDLWGRLDDLVSDAVTQVRLGFGQRLFSLYKLDEEFFRSNLHDFLPGGDDPDEVMRFIPTWRGYIHEHSLSEDLFKSLRAKYGQAITLHAEFEPETENQDSESTALEHVALMSNDAIHDQSFETLCSHLACAYTRSYISYDDDLINAVFSVSMDDLNHSDSTPTDRYFARTFETLLSNTGDRDLEKQCWERIIEFWRRRLDSINPPVTDEFQGYAQVLNHAPPSATLDDITDQLKRSAPNFTSSLPFRHVLEFLADEVTSSTRAEVSRDAIEVLHELLTYRDYPRRPPAADERWTVVKSAAADGHDLAIEIAERFFEAGEPEYQQLIDRYKVD